MVCMVYGTPNHGAMVCMVGKVCVYDDLACRSGVYDGCGGVYGTGYVAEVCARVGRGGRVWVRRKGIAGRAWV